MAKARSYEEYEEERNLPPAIPVTFGDLCLLALPVETMKALNEKAAKRGLTLAQLVQRGIDHVLGEP